jgi:hypothetical protein
MGKKYEIKISNRFAALKNLMMASKPGRTENE